VLAKKHYSNLLIQNGFEKELTKISKLVGNKNPSCLITFLASQRNSLPLVAHLEKYLNASGIHAKIDLQENCWKT